ncbi:MAG: hypothetical protein KGH98_05145 [Candidatus Micrarchaeota archaeon]|nr:hypothetical protein [Candidatus Micrarchaeota archaeon]
MKIPLEFDKTRTRLSVVATVRIKSRGPVPVAFILDTGSPVTFIDEFVSSKVRVYAKDLEFDHDALMGGTKIAMHRADEVYMNFRDMGGELAGIEFDDMMVARTEWSRKEAVYSSISILGLDFLLKCKARLFVDPSENTAYIEK